MPAKKSLKRKVYKKGPSKTQVLRTKKNRLVSFFVGVVTVIILALLGLQFVQTKNYKQILGAKSFPQTSSKIENSR